MSLDFLRQMPEFRSFCQAVKQTSRPVVATGLIEPAKPYFLAAFLQEMSEQVIVIRPSPSPLAGLEEQVRFFFSQFRSDKTTAVLPPLSENPYLEIPPALEAVSSRMRFFYQLRHRPPDLVITNLFGLLKPFPRPEDLAKAFLSLEKGEEVGRDRLLTLLDAFGYVREDLVNARGEYAYRGGIVDVFPPWQADPLRIELSGETVVSLREFAPSSQRSLRQIDRALLPSLHEFPSGPEFAAGWQRLARERGGKASSDELPPSLDYLSLLHQDHFVPFTDYLGDHLVVIDDFEAVEKDWEETFKDFREQYQELHLRGKTVLPPEDIYSPQLWQQIKSRAVRVMELNPPEVRRRFPFPFQSVPRFRNRISFFIQSLNKTREGGEKTLIYLSSEGVRRRMASLLSQHQISHLEEETPLAVPRDGSVVLLVGELHRGFSFPRAGITVFSEEDIFTEERVLIHRPRVRPFVSQFQDLKKGDYVVHADYGIGVFSGLINMRVDSNDQEFIEILYRDDDKLFVPVEDLSLVQKYAKLGTQTPVLSKLGTPQWEKTKARTKRAIAAMAKELLELYANRKAVAGHRFTPGGAWQEDFEKTFEFEETEDQLSALRDIMNDMESASPMDRLLCGDVGYGKTEVALRAAFKAVMDGKQVAVLCPTTVLASQHFATFRNRLVLFPVRVKSLTRFQTKAEQKRVAEGLKKGLVDVVIGTHRLLSKDVQFKDLGLLIIDEEQRFGVRHKERIKQMKSSIDVLTMTATPIPRTLNLSLTGLRDISLIETPPKDRLAIHTVVTPFSAKLISGAIRMELARGGQVYFIHNRVEDIAAMAHRIKTWVPQARVVTVHGQMSSPRLERNMIDFIQQKFNVLVSTTIIENGIDIPLVNTLIVNRADRFGLAQLYQLRGRVGRSSRQAVAYLLVPPYTELTPQARERLKAIQEFSELGSGFRLAAKDLEIRGAGHFLGAKQHGYVEAVGFEYYMHLLEQAVCELKGVKREDIKSQINLGMDIRIPEDFLPQINLRLNLYKRISSVESLDEVDRIRTEIKDRYGPLPENVENLLRYGVIKHLAQRAKIEKIDRVGRRLVFKFHPVPSVSLEKMKALLDNFKGSITPQGVVTLPLTGGENRLILDETIAALKELSGL